MIISGSCVCKLRHAIALMWKQSTYVNQIQLTCCDIVFYGKAMSMQAHIGKLRLCIVRLLARLWEMENCVTEALMSF